MTCCRSDLFASTFVRVCGGRVDDRFVDGLQWAAAGAPGYALTCPASKPRPRTSIAQTMRACLWASATQAFCHPARSLSLLTHWLIGSLRLCAVMTADLAAWISRVRR